MARKIAVAVDDSGRTTAITESSTIQLYVREQGKWHKGPSLAFEPDKNGGLRGLRLSAVMLVKFLTDCSIIVGLNITGVLYFELEKAGISIWEMEGKPEEWLDYVLAQEEKAAQEAAASKKNVAIPQPQAVSDGIYIISISDIQRKNSGITSKQVLLPFIRQAKFNRLEIICTHVPPWLECEAGADISYFAEKMASGEYKVVLATGN